MSRGALAVAARRRRLVQLQRLRAVALAEGDLRRTRATTAEIITTAEGALAAARAAAGLVSHAP